jgi:1-deoxy-D-xylulose-5-phosphate synthase
MGTAEVLRLGAAGPDGRRPLMVWAYGASVRACNTALQRLGADAAGVTVVNARFAKPVDQALLAELGASHDRMLTIEDHALPGGFGSAMTEAAADLGLDLSIRRLGVRDELVAHATRDQQLAAHGIDAAGIAATIGDLLGLGRETAIPFARPA